MSFMQLPAIFMKGVYYIMIEFEDIAQKRSILLTTRLRFSPEVQPIKETAIDKIIEQILFVSNSGKESSSKEIQDAFSSESGYAINFSDMEDSLKRLIENKRIILKQKRNLQLYELTDEAKREITDLQYQAEGRFNSVVNRLFKNTREGSSTYNGPFLKFLCIIFSQFGEESVRLIKGDVKVDNFLSSSSIPSILEKIKKEFPSIDYTLFKSAVLSFFQDSDPEYDMIKWNIAQNYYIAKALGLDPNGVLLSKEVFGHAIFYLDTNIILEALEPKQRHYESFLTFSKACRQLGVTLKVCQITLNELLDSLAYQRSLIEKVIDQIPDDTAPKIRSIFYETYYEKKMSGEVVNIDDLFINFRFPKDDLNSLFGVQFEDDPWFNEIKNKPETKSFARMLEARYKKVRGYPKGPMTALHDAMLILWLQKLRKENKGNIWLITMDTTLPGSVPQNTSSESFAITLDALLQWISPIAVPESEENSFAATFAKMIRYRLLPQEKIFNLEDFLIFNEIHMSCKELPAKDVENCIRYIKVNAPMLDPSDSADREKLAYEVSKFFTDPGRKYKQDLARLESENIKTKQEYEKKIDEALKSNVELKKQHEREIEELNKKIEELNKKRLEDEERTKKESLKRSAWRRLIILITFVFSPLEGLVIFLANWYGAGQNFLQKVLSFWPYLVVGIAVTTLIGGFIIGKERLKSLGWPFTKIFKV
jgi:hypothetical protein